MPFWKQAIYLLTSGICLAVGIPLSLIAAFFIGTACSLSAACMDKESK